MRILAVDPGKMTGVAHLHGGGFYSYEAPTHDALHYARGVIYPGVDLVVCEAFIISARTLKGTRQYDALESIGALRFFCQDADVPFKLIPPSASKRFATDDKLKAVGWYRPSKGGHQNDAARVLLTAAVEYGVVNAADLLPRDPEQIKGRDDV